MEPVDEIGSAAWIAEAWSVLSGLTNRRETATDSEAVALAESDARKLIAECRRFITIASDESALDHEVFVREANELVDAALQLIGNR